MTVGEKIFSFTPFSLEMVGKRNKRVLSVRGVMRISEASEGEIILLTVSGRVGIFGREMSVCVLERGVVEIVGAIVSIELMEGAK